MHKIGKLFLEGLNCCLHKNLMIYCRSKCENVSIQRFFAIKSYDFSIFHVLEHNFLGIYSVTL